jgi:hypothetical protein
MCGALFDTTAPIHFDEQCVGLVVTQCRQLSFDGDGSRGLAVVVVAVVKSVIIISTIILLYKLEILARLISADLPVLGRGGVYITPTSLLSFLSSFPFVTRWWMCSALFRRKGKI